MTQPRALGGASAVVRGTIVSFSAGAWTALVLVDGSLAEVSLPVLETVQSQMLAADDIVAVLLFDQTNPETGVVLGPYGGTGLQDLHTAADPTFDQLTLTNDLQQAEIAAPATPASGYLRWWADSSQSWGYFKPDDGAAVPAGLARFYLPMGAALLATPTVVAVQTNHLALSFPDAADHFAYWSIMLPPGWAGRNMLVRFLWAPSTTNTGACSWHVAYHLQKAGATLSATAVNTSQTDQAANGTADRPQSVATGSLSLSTFADGDGLSIRIGRLGTHVNDTFTGAARLLSAELSVVG